MPLLSYACMRTSVSYKSYDIIVVRHCDKRGIHLLVTQSGCVQRHRAHVPAAHLRHHHRHVVVVVCRQCVQGILLDHRSIGQLLVNGMCIVLCTIMPLNWPGGDQFV